jgi:DNA-binding PadR family transcriptional regulator
MDESNMPRPLGLRALQILAAIRDGRAYGLDIVATTGLPSGTVYPTLGRLRRSGHVRTRWEDQRRADQEGRSRRRYYELSRAGEKALAEGTERVTEMARALKAGGRKATP